MVTRPLRGLVPATEDTSLPRLTLSHVSLPGRFCFFLLPLLLLFLKGDIHRACCISVLIPWVPNFVTFSFLDGPPVRTLLSVLVPLSPCITNTTPSSFSSPRFRAGSQLSRKSSPKHDVLPTTTLLPAPPPLSDLCDGSA